MMSEKTWKQRHEHINEIMLQLTKVNSFMAQMPDRSLPEKLNDKLRGFVKTLEETVQILDYFSVNIEFEHLNKEER